MKKTISFFLCILVLFSAVGMNAYALNAEETAVKKGDIISFGHYEQDNNVKNGNEDIEWIVLDVQGDKCYLLSSCILDGKKFNEKETGARPSWKTSAIRKWLNNDFINQAFSDEEKDAIVCSSIKSSDWLQAYSPEYSEDYIFLMSFDEISDYFSDVEIIPYAISDYAKENGNPFYWLTRTWDFTNPDSVYCAPTDPSDLFEHEVYAYHTWGVRPAMWLNLSKWKPDGSSITGNNAELTDGLKYTETGRPIVVDKNGFISNGASIAEGMIEMLKPGILFKSVSSDVEKTKIDWQENEYIISCGNSNVSGTISFLDSISEKSEGKDDIPSDIVLLSITMKNPGKEEVSAFASYGRAFIYLCSTCNSGVEANDIFIEIQDENYLNTQKWVSKDGMEYNMQGEQNTDGSITYYIAVRKM